MDGVEATKFIVAMPERFRIHPTMWDILRTMLERHTILLETHEQEKEILKVRINDLQVKNKELEDELDALA